MLTEPHLYFLGIGYIHNLLWGVNSNFYSMCYLLEMHGIVLKYFKQLYDN